MGLLFFQVLYQRSKYQNLDTLLLRGPQRFVIYMYFMYTLFGGLFLLISLTGSFSEGLVLLPVAVVSIPLTKWGIRWQNERYIRSAQNQDDIDIIKERLAAIEERINKLEDR